MNEGLRARRGMRGASREGKGRRGFQGEVGREGEGGRQQGEVKRGR